MHMVCRHIAHVLHILKVYKHFTLSSNGACYQQIRTCTHALACSCGACYQQTQARKHASTQARKHARELSCSCIARTFITIHRCTHTNRYTRARYQEIHTRMHTGRYINARPPIPAIKTRAVVVKWPLVHLLAHTKDRRKILYFSSRGLHFTPSLFHPSPKN